MFEVDVYENLLLIAKGTAETGSNSVFGDASRNKNGFRRKMHRKYRMILSVLDPRKCEYLKDYSLYFEHAYMTT